MKEKTKGANTLIYVTGDTHGDFTRFQSPILKKAEEGDYLIVCGDFGFFWDDSKKEQKLRQKIDKLKFTVCFVDGCHENYDLLEKYPTRKWNGGVARINENRIIGWKSPETYISQFFGTEGCYEFSVASHYQTVWDPDTAKNDLCLHRNSVS